MFPFFWDPTFIILLPAIILSLYAQMKVRSTFQRYLRVETARGITGREVAQRLLQINGMHDVRVEMTPGSLSDHYDPRTKTVKLSPEVYQGSSIAAVGVAAHETGHAVQHRVGYTPLTLRSAFVPVAQIGSTLAFPLLLVGLIFSSLGLIQLGIILFSGVVLFQIITLPVEFNASQRAVALLQSTGMLSPAEVGPTRQVLNAAALTYVAAAAVAVLNLVRFLLLAGLLRRDD